MFATLNRLVLIVALQCGIWQSQINGSNQPFLDDGNRRTAQVMVRSFSDPNHRID